jgi:hypothetical protein
MRQHVSLRTSLFIVALWTAVAVVLSSAPATAKRRHHDFVCWMMPSGHTACGYVADPYRVRGLAFKPHRHRDRRVCNLCYSDHVLSNGSIRDFGRYTDASTMRRFHEATVYGEKNRGNID